MLWSLALFSALAGDVVVDGKVPFAVVIDGEMSGQVFREGELRLDVPMGKHLLAIVVNGRSTRFDIEVGAAPVRVLVGRSGVTMGAPEPVQTVADGPAEVRFRVVGKVRLMVQVGKQRVLVGPGEGLALPLTAGSHSMSVRSSDGTVVYARGVLELQGGEGAIVQLAEGAMPETSGSGVAFLPDRS